MLNQKVIIRIKEFNRLTNKWLNFLESKLILLQILKASLDSVQLRDLKQGEVLIKVETSTINPSDYHIAIGHYGPGTAPFILGYEGSGTVLKSGGGEQAEFLINKRVAILNPGTWAEYNIAPATSVFPLLDSTTFEQAASLIVNPFTVVGFIEIIRQGNHKAVAINAAASAIGKIIIR